MRIGRFRAKDGGERIAIVVDLAGKRSVLDANKALQHFNGPKPSAAAVKGIIAEGRPAVDKLNAVAEWAVREGEANWLSAPDDLDWLVPTEPRTFVCAGRNFGRHRDESLAFWTKKGLNFHFDFPTGFIQLPHLMVPHRGAISSPSYVQELDYEVEVAAVIGRSVDEAATPENALDYVFGYTVFNDISAREWQRKEMQNQTIIVGKNFPGAAPVGPWILTADEAGDPGDFVLDLDVNGRSLQHEKGSDMVFGFPQLIAHWGPRLQLIPGDLVGSGTPEGVAMHRKPDPFEYYLKPGDLVRASVEPIGTLETRVV